MGDDAGGGGERSAIARRAGLVAAGTLSSRVLGAVRDAVIAACFTRASTDAFFVAFTIPNSLRVLLGEGAVSGAFVPVFSEVRQTEGMERAQRFYAGLVGAMTVVLLIVTVAGVVLAPQLVGLYAEGFRDEPDLFDRTVSLTRVVFPYIFLIGLAALGMGALNAMKRFTAPAFAPGLLNVALIAAPFTLIPAAEHFGMSPVAALVIGALIGGVLQAGALLPSLRSVGLLRWPRFGFDDPYVRKAFGLLLPLIAGLGVYQLNVLLSRRFASFLPEGAVSYLYYGQRLVEIPQGMFALAIATATLPTLADMRSRGEDAAARKVFRYGLRLSLFVAIPSSVALSVLAEPTVAVIFGRGAFSAEAIAETARSLVWQAAGIWAVACVRTVVPLFHAYNDTRSPVVGSGVNLVVFVATSLALTAPMQHAGIALAISAAAVVQLATLIGLLRYKTGPLGLTEVADSAVRACGAAAIMGAVVWGVARAGDWPAGGNDPLNVAILTAAILVGAACYLGAARLLGAPEVAELGAALRSRVRRDR